MEGTRSSRLLDVSQEIWDHCLITGTRPQINYIPSAINPADAPSRLVCYETEQEGFGVCQLVPGPSGVSDKRIPASLEIFDQSICVSPMELDPASHPEDQAEKTNNDPDYSLLEATLWFPDLLKLSVQRPLPIPACYKQ
ncbi:hypothetical protein AX774_g6983 [Zancudomyces culisetae]|uniref:Uncharacterized protein n=1 Tax=Zancudomyces culisetae TaxID=1213189 RepID=A0A1R1PF23_ZANCU|nr:hypothetical protein AX774_g6983 [Zancudomyces culisetae]|eukprot:OMH79600.1 hypothetical protein AX774_g6983 [Zancudomyces culisetae]